MLDPQQILQVLVDQTHQLVNISGLLVVEVELQEELVEQVQHLLLVQQTEQVLVRVVQVVTILLRDMVLLGLDLVEVVMDGAVVQFLVTVVREL